MSVIVLDPGHGGGERIGGSSANSVVGPAGTREKDLTLDLARRVRDRLQARGHTALLTRDRDANRSLADRVALAHRRGADAFVSLHFNAGAAGVQASETYVHSDAGPASVRLAHDLHRRLLGATGHADGGLMRAALGVLDPRLHARRTAAALLEVSYLSDPREERRLQDAAYRDRLAGQIARGLEDHLARHGDGQQSFVRAVPPQCASIADRRPAVHFPKFAMQGPQRMLAAYHAVGEQVYASVPEPGMSGAYKWKLLRPDATLFDGDGQPVGQHSAVAQDAPSWSVDGSLIVAEKRDVVDAARPTVDVPNVRLEVTTPADRGVFRGVRYVERLNTRGGQPTEPASAAHLREEHPVRYEADYFFFGPDADAE